MHHQTKAQIGIIARDANCIAARNTGILIKADRGRRGRVVDQPRLARRYVEFTVAVEPWFIIAPFAARKKQQRQRAYGCHTPHHPTRSSAPSVPIRR